MAYTEILLPHAYVNDPGGYDFAVVGQPLGHFADEAPAAAVSALSANDTPIPPAGGGTSGYEYFWAGKSHGRGRFTMSNPTLTGVVQSVAVRILPYGYWGYIFYLRLWTHGVLYETMWGDPAGQSDYPPGVGWEIREKKYLNNPFTLATWTTAELIDANAGFRIQSTQMDQVYLLVTYSKVLPQIGTVPASGILPAQATLNGFLTDDGGEACTLFFEWGNTPALGNVAAGVPGVGPTGTAFSATIGGLVPDVPYFFRAGATNSVGTNYGTVMSFSTASIPFGGGTYCSKVLIELL